MKTCNCMIQVKGVDGKLTPVWVCKNNGGQYGTPECPYTMVSGKCESRADTIRGSKHRRSEPRHRKWDSTQKGLFSEHMRGVWAPRLSP